MKNKGKCEGGKGGEQSRGREGRRRGMESGLEGRRQGGMGERKENIEEVFITNLVCYSAMHLLQSGVVELSQPHTIHCPIASSVARHANYSLSQPLLSLLPPPPPGL